MTATGDATALRAARWSFCGGNAATRTHLVGDGVLDVPASVSTRPRTLEVSSRSRPSPRGLSAKPTGGVPRKYSQTREGSSLRQRRRDLRIPPSAASGRRRSLRCSSFPQQSLTAPPGPRSRATSLGEGGIFLALRASGTSRTPSLTKQSCAQRGGVTRTNPSQRHPNPYRT